MPSLVSRRTFSTAASFTIASVSGSENVFHRKGKCGSGRCRNLSSAQQLLRLFRLQPHGRQQGGFAILATCRAHWRNSPWHCPRRASALRNTWTPATLRSLQQQAEVVDQIRNTVAVDPASHHRQRATAGQLQNTRGVEASADRSAGSGDRAKEEPESRLWRRRRRSARQIVAAATETDLLTAAHVRRRRAIAGRTAGAGQPVFYD